MGRAARASAAARAEAGVPAGTPAERAAERVTRAVADYREFLNGRERLTRAEERTCLSLYDAIKGAMRALLGART